MRSLVSDDNRKVYPLHNPGLLASSPFPFTYCRGITLVTPTHLAMTLGLKGSANVPPMHCILIPDGIRMRLLCLPLSDAPSRVLKAFRAPKFGSACAECKQLGEVATLALLQCEDEDGHLIALLLCPSREKGGNIHRFFIGTHGQCPNKNHEPSRTVNLAKEALAEVLVHVRPVTVEVLLLRHYSYPPIPKSLPQLSSDSLLSPVPGPVDFPDGITFAITPHSIDTLDALGFVPSPLQITHTDRQVVLETTLNLSGGCSSHVPYTIELRLLLRRLEGESASLCLYVKVRTSSSHAITTVLPLTLPSLESRSASIHGTSFTS